MSKIKVTALNQKITSEIFYPPPAPLTPPPAHEALHVVYSAPPLPLSRKRRVNFQLPRIHIERDSTSWRQSPRSRSSRTARQKGEKAKHFRCRLNRPLTPRLIKYGVLDGTTPSAISDTGATSSAGLIQDAAHFTATGRRSTKIFHVANGASTPATEERLLQHPLRAPARTIDMVPSLHDASLLSTGRLADAGYVTIYDGDQVNFYNGRTSKIQVSEAAVLQGWRCPETKLWRIPLTADPQNYNTDTLLLDTPDGRGSLNSLYHMSHVKTMRARTSTNKAVNHVYKLPSVKPAIRYLHAAAGFPTKATWIKAI